MASSAGRRHPVTLLAPSGREQPVLLLVGRDGIRLTTVDGKDINTFAYETIRKWLPSHLRSKNPGPDDCLDIQIETDKGPRDLRMRCASATAVKQLMKDLRDTVESIMREMDDRQIQQLDQAQQQQGAQMRELPSISATVPALSQHQQQAGGRPDSAATSRSNAETQTLADVTSSAQSAQQHPSSYDSGPGHAPAGMRPFSASSPVLVHSPGGGVAQLFVAHPTGVALPVSTRGVTTPALMDGLQQATMVPLFPASGTFAYEFLDQYGVPANGDGTGELEVTDRASSTATGFYNVMFQQPRPATVHPGLMPAAYSNLASPSMPSPSPPLSPGMPSGGASSGGYYPASFEALNLAGMTAMPPPPVTAHSPPMYYGAPISAPLGPSPMRPPVFPPHMQPQAGQQPQQQQHGYPAPPPHYPPLPRAGSQRMMRSPGAGLSARPPRRSDPASSSPVRRRVEFSGLAAGTASESEASDIAVPHYLSRNDGGGGGGNGEGTTSTAESEAERGGARGAGDGGKGVGAAGTSGTAAGGGANVPPGADPDMQLQVRFLEDLVARLSAEVSRRAVSPERATAAALALAGAADPASPGPAGPQQPAVVLGGVPGATATAGLLATPAPTAVAPPQPIDYEGLLSADALGAAAVLRDQKLLAPLLAAYDNRIAALEVDLRSRTEQVQALKSQVDDVVEENDRLRSEMDDATATRDAALAQASNATAAAAAANSAAVAAAAAGASNSEELELLRRENELLVTQQGEMDAEIQRLHNQLQERAQEAIRAGQEQAALLAQAQEANAKAQEAEARAAKLADTLRASEAKGAALATQVSRTKAAADEAATAAATTKAALDELRHSHAQLQAEAAAAHQRYKVAADGAASLQLELSTQRERSDTLQIQVSALTRECDTLRSALGGVESKLTELQRKDVDVWTRVKEAMSAAEEARLARDTALARCGDLERQVELANARLNTVRQATRDAVADEFSTQLSAAHAATQQVREELTAAHTAVSEWRARAERLEREQASLTAELAALREDTAAALASKSRLGLASLGAVEKVAALERERDEAVAKLESAQRKAERVARDAQLERQQVENTMRGLKSNIAELETALSTTRAEVANGKRQLEAAQRELAAVKAARQQAEMELKQQIATLRAEREAEVRAFTHKLEQQASAAAAAAADAERLLSNKQEVLARWREEAQTLASRMEAALSEHKRELSAKGHEAAELRGRVEALSAENVELAAAVSELEGKIDDLQAQLADADAQADAAATQVIGANNREAELQQELRQLQMMLDRTQFEKNRMQRAHDPLTAKYDALKKDIRQTVATAPTAAGTLHGSPTGQLPSHVHTGGMAGVAGLGTMGWSGSPDAVVHAARVPRGHPHHHATSGSGR